MDKDVNTNYNLSQKLATTLILIYPYVHHRMFPDWCHFEEPVLHFLLKTMSIDEASTYSYEGQYDIRFVYRNCQKMAQMSACSAAARRTWNTTSCSSGKTVIYGRF
jgi:hypothetical protein